MILYHGTDQKFKIPLLSKSIAHKDFGNGFYTTERLDMAKDWGKGKNPVRYSVNVYEVADNILEVAVQAGMRVKHLTANAEWAEFVYDNREREDFIHDYDIVAGPVADNYIEGHFAKIRRGEATFEEIALTLPYRKFKADQICFCSERALELLNYVNRNVYPQSNRTNHRNRHRRNRG